MPYLNRHGAGHAPNPAGGSACAVDDWTRLRRLLVLGSEGGRYYASEWTLTRENATAVERCIRTDGRRAVEEIVRVSDEGRAPKSDPALFGLAMAAGLGDADTRRAALDALPQVARTGTQLFQFATFVEGFRGWGRSLRRAVGRWYADQPVDALADQAVKHRRRGGIQHRDLLRLAHPGQRVSAGNPSVAVTEDHRRLFEWMARGRSSDGLRRLVEGFVRAQAAQTPAETARLVADNRLPREAIRAEHLGAPDVWTALLADMPMTELVRNLAKMTRVGVLAPGSAGTVAAVARLRDAEEIRRERLDPIALLAALRTYGSARGVRGRARWTPVAEVVDALDAAFHTAFRNVQPTGKRLLLALDVSSSMAWGDIAGVPGVTPHEASTAMALLTAATEPHHEIVGFFAGGWFRDRRRHRLPTRTPRGATSTPCRRSATTVRRPASTPAW
jgi:60 kDa SS-A/Ro ribonucleoprotein